MAAKLLHSLADDNPDLQKQIGCMTGIFQIFDRQQIGRRINGQNHKRLLPPGNSQFSNASLGADSSNAYCREIMERTANNYTNDKRLSIESSRASFSSDSRSSSFSSLDCGRLGHPDPSSLDRIIFPDTPYSDPVITQPSPSPKVGRLSLDLRDLVKDSMHRESRGLPAQLNMKEDGVGQMSRDSPCPLHLSNSVEGPLGSTVNGKNDLPADLKESLKVLAKLREVPGHYSEKQHARFSHETNGGSLVSVSRDAPRYSYDGRELSRLSFEPRDFSKSNQRINDLPRLSLDSRESSMWTSSYESNVAYLPSNEDAFYTKQLSRPPSVVAKLMGLETFPDNKPYRDGHCGSTNSFEDCHHHHSMPSKTSDRCRPIRLPVSPRSSKKEPTSPRWKNAEMRPISSSSSKCSNEPAPWRHVEGSSSRTSQQQATRRTKFPESSSKSSPSVYSEIEKRLNDLEFKQSGKDLRALKQILEAMQAKGFLGMSKEETDLNMGTKIEDGQSYTGPSMNSGFINPNESHRNQVAASSPRRTGSNTYESPIVIMKPAKLVQRSGISASSLIPIDGLPDLGLQGRDITRHEKLDAVNRRPSRDQSHKESQRENTAKSSSDRKANNSRSLREAQNSTRAQRVSNDSSSKNLGSTSPRLQKKLEFDKRSRPPTPPDSGKSRRQSNRQLNEAGGSPGGRRRPKPIMQQNTDQLSDVSSETRNISSLRDDLSVRSESVATLEPKRDAEVTSKKRSVDLAECEILPLESLKYPDASKLKMNSSTRSSDDELAEELPAVAPEHPSPISVLDNSAYRENSPPPVKQTLHDLEGVGTKTIEQDNGKAQWNPSSANHDRGSGFPTEINHNKLQNIENLIQKLRRLNSNHDEARTDYIASLCENPNPDHRYVSEILLASGLLLRDLSSGLVAELHQSGYPINPELFLVLEQTKSSSLHCKAECNPDEDNVTRLKLSKEKFHRKLIFDVVNEILTGKLVSLGQVAEPRLKPTRLARKTLNAQKFLAELCAEIEKLNATQKQEFRLEEDDDSLKIVLSEDVMHRTESWTDFCGDISGIVLDVERSIFKELVDEVVIGESTGLCGKPSRRRRQLFSK